MTNQISLRSLLKLESLLIISSISVTLYLVFIDEGNYGFTWTYNTADLVAMVFYTLFFYWIQYMFFKLILGRIEIVGKTISILVIIMAVVSMVYLGIVN